MKERKKEREACSGQYINNFRNSESRAVRGAWLTSVVLYVITHFYQRLQQLCQPVNIGLDSTRRHVTPCTRATNNQRIIAIPTAFNGKNIIARQ